MALAAAELAVQPFTLKRVAKVGDTLVYKLNVDADFGGQKVNVTGKATDKVVKVSENGEITTESKQTETKIKVGDQEIPMDEQPVQTTTSDAKGLVIKIEGDQVDSSVYRLSNMSVFRIPDSAVKVGDKWTHEFKADAKTGAVAGKSEYEVLAVEKVGSFETLKVKWTFKETEGGEPASAEGTVWVDTKDGSMVKAVGNYKAAPLPGAPGPVDMTITLERE